MYDICTEGTAEQHQCRADKTATTWPEGVCIKYVPTSVIHSEEATRKQIRHGKCIIEYTYQTIILSYLSEVGCRDWWSVMMIRTQRYKWSSYYQSVQYILVMDEIHLDLTNGPTYTKYASIRVLSVRLRSFTWTGGWSCFFVAHALWWSSPSTGYFTYTYDSFNYFSSMYY